MTPESVGSGDPSPLLLTALYMAGILFVHMFPGFDPNEIDDEEPAEEVAV